MRAMRGRKRQSLRDASPVLERARMMLGSLEALAEDDPDLVDQWAAVIRDHNTEADGWSFALRTTTPYEPLLPHVMVTTPLGLMFLDPTDGHVIRGLSWPHFCSFEATRPADLTQIHFSWYIGDGKRIEERLKDPRPIGRDECEGWILLSDAAEPLIADIFEYVSIAGVPADRYDMAAP